jgi:hypothetical protein
MSERFHDIAVTVNGEEVRERVDARKTLVDFLSMIFFRPAFARRSIKPNGEACQGLRAGGKPVPTFRDHALSTEIF